MEHYAIKTTKGYLAIQDRLCWFQDTPTGWAAFSGEEAARDIAERHHSVIGTRPEEGYQIETIHN